jgi:hypothetical protein
MRSAPHPRSFAQRDPRWPSRSRARAWVRASSTQTCSCLSARGASSCSSTGAARRVAARETATRWITALPRTRELPLGYFGASTGAAAALARSLAPACRSAAQRGRAPSRRADVVPRWGATDHRLTDVPTKADRFGMGIHGASRLVAAALVAGCGCSLAAVRRPPPAPAPPDVPLECTQSRVAPALDTAGAIGAPILGLTTWWLCAVTSAMQSWSSDPKRLNCGVVLGATLVSTAAYTGSAVYGYRATAECRRIAEQRRTAALRTEMRSSHQVCADLP